MAARGHWKQILALVTLALAPPVAAQVDYDIAFVRAPHGDNWPEVLNPFNMQPGADLYLLRPDGSTDPLVECDPSCSITDPFPTFDAASILYSRCEMGGGCDIWRVEIATGATEQLTHGEYEGDHADGESVYNMGPAPIPGGRIVFTSTRYGYRPPRRIGLNPRRSPQLFAMRADGSEVEQVGAMNIGAALHPTPTPDGRVLFSTLESQGLRDPRQWGLWSIYPDGRNWAPVVSSFFEAKVTHFQTVSTDRATHTVAYYNLNNWGFGTLLSIPPGRAPAFESKDGGSPVPRLFGSRDCGRSVGTWDMPFMPRDAYTLTPWTHPEDHAASCREGSSSAGERVGKVTMPSAAPDNALLIVWSPGPVNKLTRPVNSPEPHGGIHLIPDAATPVTDPWDRAQLPELYREAGWNAMYPRALVPWEAIYGEPMPDLGWLPNMTRELPVADLPDGTPYGYVGSSSLYKRESFPGEGVDAYDGLDPDNTKQNAVSSNISIQGGDVGLYSNAEIAAIRILALEPSRPGDTFDSAASERAYVLADVPVRKPGVTDPDGNPDTSFLAWVPADTPFTFQLLDGEGRALSLSQAWHQVRPGEVRVDCGGCHAHSSEPTDFWSTAAGQPGYQAHDATGKPEVIEWEDVRPLLARMTGSIYGLGFGSLSDDGRYQCLAEDDDGACIPSYLTTGKWRQSNLSALVRGMQSRRSRIAWEAFGARLDGWTDADHPPSDDTIGDLDFEGGHLAHDLTPDEARLIARWIDTGSARGADFRADTLKPTVTLTPPGDMVRFGAADAHSGIASVSVTATRSVAGRAPGEELADLAAPVGDGTWELVVVAPAEANGSCPAPGGCSPLTTARQPRSAAGEAPYAVTVVAEDGAGNRSALTRWSTTGDAPPPPPPPPVECGDGLCDASESCETCETDCGPCEPPPCPECDSCCPEPPECSLTIFELDEHAVTLECREAGE